MATLAKKIVSPVASGARLMSTGGGGASATAGKHAEAHAKMWANISYFLVLPGVAIASFITFKNESAHHEPPPEFVPYEHMRIRKKNFPFGDGKRSFFHNPETNPLPDGYEVEPHH
ncbi:cytochrome c oxidase subunit 6A, mitochondrial-like [Thrips palmi]|uniref:Cytochrome c oxidase subunit 6A, mitochondrial-like n=1 Tax=Thrips palmi TaxID=161013 RepID=A0A6P8YV73_THRPL|nr:cytochrome c oxidase subunit 6A, mitochondrial-like [Thrips palmi]